jgi:hypothetical protein
VSNAKGANVTIYSLTQGPIQTLKPLNKSTMTFIKITTKRTSMINGSKVVMTPVRLASEAKAPGALPITAPAPVADLYRYDFTFSPLSYSPPSLPCQCIKHPGQDTEYQDYHNECDNDWEEFRYGASKF